MERPLPRALGLARSVAYSYGPVWRRRRMTAFYARFVRPGDLAFDLGAHLGNRVGALRRAGAQVIALEPQPDLVRVLRGLYGRDPGVVIDARAVGAEPGTTTLHASSRTPTVSTTAAGWIPEVSRARSFGRVRWDRALSVAVTTLDELIAEHGVPQFCKIDVEGSEPDVLRGLSRPLPALSFEYVPSASARALACVDLLEALGAYRFTCSRLETLRWSAPWQDADGIREVLRGLTPDESPGDVYARLT